MSAILQGMQVCQTAIVGANIVAAGVLLKFYKMQGF
jgi:hypothetical protein